ncbi:MAG: undecaprenyldiphospho-muramoylpentapeptide beta-N-acetylglucosaminyltransferase [Ruminococcus sp.]|jgi:UDP-N-acetylglucosamine--N-acetylmuramyl-(pentapeptide) pyrophosphoryl-undecaprenol N-acetylglucosamine transferase|nr:undecaprenyldiphospho-muramoylpentapeptide beta-N-acetylglucosaminyltransferase [Ruminococcus sp.]
MKILITGGGTAGHINPALAIAGIVKKYKPDTEFLFAGTPFGMESKLVPEAGYNFAPIKVRGFQRSLSPKNIVRNAKAAAYLTTAGQVAKKIIKDFNPDIAIGTGGYVSGPIIRTAAKMHIPTAIHEANAFPGLTTKLLSKYVDIVMLTVEDAKTYLPDNVTFTVTGLPVRENITRVSRDDARKKLHLADNMTILSFGGSLGANCINDLAEDLMEHFENDNINFIHGYGQNGRGQFKDMKDEKVIISEYIHNMNLCLAAADLVICRAGASTLAELMAVGRASILIPSPIVAGNHQFHNACVLGNAGGAIVIEQKDVRFQKIADLIKKMYQNRDMLTSMAQKTASLNIADVDKRVWKAISGVFGDRTAIA